MQQVSNDRRSRIVAMLLWLFYSMEQSIAGWIDPDTPEHFYATESMSGSADLRPYRLVFSDEFEQKGRLFHDGSDPRWTAISKNDYTNMALHYYSADNAVTSNGVLSITTELKDNTYRAFNETTKQFFADQKHVQSGMLQSWNKFCFIGGIVEISAKLPGDPYIGGLWPALWMLGNLARATYIGSSNYIWPYSYNTCDSRNRKSQLINACSQVNHFGLDPFRGRGSPEIDILEAMQGEAGDLPSTFIERPYQSTSLQIAPGIETDRPVLGMRPHMSHWYEGLEYSDKNISDLNPFFYGVSLKHQLKDHSYQSDALSANTQLNKSHYDTQHVYRIEWDPPTANGTGGFIKWFTDGDMVYSIHAVASSWDFRYHALKTATAIALNVETQPALALYHQATATISPLPLRSIISVSTKRRMKKNIYWVVLRKAARRPSSLRVTPKTTWPKVTDDPSKQFNEVEGNARNTLIVGETTEWDLAYCPVYANAQLNTLDQTA